MPKIPYSPCVQEFSAFFVRDATIKKATQGQIHFPQAQEHKHSYE